MGWLLGCFKCTGDFKQVKPKRQSSGVATLVSGRASSAAVAHATSPEDLRRVRKSPPNLAVANNNGYVETGCQEPSSSAKTSEGANLGLKLNRERNSRERRVLEADAAGDEVKDSRSCHRVLQPPLKVTSNKSEKDRSDLVRHHSWLVSSLVTRNGLLFEASSRPSSPFSGLYEHGSLHSKGMQASQSIDFYDNLGSGKALKRVELSTFRVESGVSEEHINVDGESLKPASSKVKLKTEAAPFERELQSPPWTFSEARLDIANHKNSCLFESSDDLLLEHLDVSSLIEDSALITNWELTSGELHSEKWGWHEQPPHVPSQGGGKLPQFSGQTKQDHLETEAVGDSLDLDSSCSVAVFEVPSDDGTGGFPSEGDDHCLSNAVLSAAQAPHDASFGNIDYNANARLLQADLCTDIGGCDNESGSWSCFSSQFKLSNRLWSSTRKDPSERDSKMVGHWHDDDNDADEVLLPRTHPEMQVLQKLKNSEYASKEHEHGPLLNALTESSETSNDNRVGCNECSGVHKGNYLRSSTASLLEALVRQDSVEAFAFEDEVVAMRGGDLNAVSSPSGDENGEQRKKLRLGHSSSFEMMQDELVAMGERDLNAVSSPSEDENGEQRKKLRLGHSNSVERMQNSMSVVDDGQVGLHSTTDFGDCHDNSLGAIVDISSGPGSIASEQSIDESSLEQTSNLSFTSPSPSHVQTRMASYRSPASLADDRPILGTVAAHWSPITTKKWWDGKGIPNSTNKYKEDQKVNWHAVPFEVRLEQALAKQESVLSK